MMILNLDDFWLYEYHISNSTDGPKLNYETKKVWKLQSP
jgi:hypothetical protein